jgi:hypothetical protein
MTYNDWLMPPVKPESFKQWEKRHAPCLQIREGKPFYDWLAAKKVGKRNGEVPAGLCNGIIGRMLPDRLYSPRLIALYSQYRREFYALGLTKVYEGKALRLQPRGYFDFALGYLSGEGHREWRDANVEEYEAAKAELDNAPEAPIEPDAARAKYEGYVAMMTKYGLSYSPWEAWLENYLAHQTNQPAL